MKSLFFPQKRKDPKPFLIVRLEQKPEQGFFISKKEGFLKAAPPFFTKKGPLCLKFKEWLKFYSF